jgi:NitT/TauT family transport system permease protein
LLRNFLSPFIVILNAVPRVALAPLFILWFGIGIRAGTAFVIAIIFFLVFVNLFTGVQTIDRLYLMNARALGGGKLWILREVYIPSVLAWLIASLRNAVALALLGAAVAELIAGTAGLGFLIAQGTNSGNSAEVIAAALILALVTLLANSVISRVERNLLAWQLSQ